MPTDAITVPPPTTTAIAANVHRWALLRIEEINHAGWALWAAGLYYHNYHLASVLDPDTEELRVWLCRKDCRPIVYLGRCPKWVVASNKTQPGLS